MRRSWGWVALVAAVLGSAGAAAADPPVPVQSPTVQIAPDAAWTWFSEPRAVQVGDSTYLGWISSTGDITIGAFDSATHRTQTFVLMTGFQVDDHNNPAVLLRPDGRLQAFWSAHNGADLFMRVSLRPRDISAWGPLRTVPVKAAGDLVSTYANPVVLSAEGHRLYVFARSGYLDPTFTTSPDLGRTWTRAQRLLAEPDQRPYVKYAGNGRDTIAMAYTNGHPAETHSSIYFAQYRDGALRGASGRVVARMSQLPVRPARGDLVYAAPPDRDAWVHDTALDKSGRPRIIFATMPQGDSGDHDYWYAAWTGSRWLTTRITGGGRTISDDPREPAYSAGISFDHADPAIVVLARPGQLGKHEVERWTTPDLGQSWTRESITTASSQDNVRPVIPRGGPGRVVWMTGRYGFFTSFRTAAATDALVVPAAPLPTSLYGRVAVRGTVLDVHASLTSGALLAAPGRELTLQRRPAGWRTWHQVALATTDRGGRAGFRVVRRSGFEYRIVWPGDTSLARSESAILRS